ncbi:glycosyl transferase family 2 (plasmid) [Solidesulfovibrio carbinoliphilus subsp. oakridgensis]|uniref:Glycosyl transferase family 2 n=1 Tax=Solidesulfovibrio carbinoliphilus subsp. oakridgensis TaxID=694327 RepID=G7QE47_9BACT|nr:glycosyltransferase [Solidesulfovibrio carbinoliphilus]EHJ45941.1 glycosyl transferase family 2 [Solidesulfovibrio carbinoliphilus subsp. oakridgensis]
MKQQGVPDLTTSHPGIDILEPGCRVSPTCTVRRPGDTADAALIRLGRDCTLLDNVRLVVADPRESPASGLTLGDRVIVNVGCYLSGEGGLVIEDEVLLGPHVQILSAGQGLEPAQAGAAPNPSAPAPVAIERGAWIGAGAIILPGCRVGAGAVVGAGSVVASDVPPLAVVAGNPARVMRRRLDTAAGPEGPEAPGLPAGPDPAEEHGVLRLLYDDLKSAHAALRRERDLLQNNYLVLEKGYLDLKDENENLGHRCRDLREEGSQHDARCAAVLEESEALRKHYVRLEEGYKNLLRQYEAVRLAQAGMVQILQSRRHLTRYYLQKMLFGIDAVQASQLRSFAWLLRHRLRPRTRWNTLRDRYRQFGWPGVARLFYEFALRQWKGDQGAAGEAADPAVSLETAKARLREQAEAGFRDFLASDETIRFAPGDRPWLSIVLVLWGQAELTLACLRALAGEAGEGVEIVIVDNASPDATPSLLDRVHGATILRNQDNVGFLLAANQGAMAAAAPLVLFLNNDAVPRPGSLGQARALLAADAGIGAVGGRILLPDGRLQEAGCVVWSDGSCAGYLRGEAAEAPEALFRRDVDFCSGVFLMTRTGLFKELGGFDEAFAPAYYEEVDYCMRLWEHGARVVYDPWIVVDHYEYGSAGSSEAAAKRMATNQKRFQAKHARALADQESAALAGAMLRARMRGTGAARVLYVDDRVPRPDLGGGFPRAQALLAALGEHGLFATVVSLAEPMTTPARRPDDGLPPGFEVMPGLTPDKLVELLEARQGYYDLFFVSRPSNMERLAFLFTEQAGLLGDMAVLYDAEAVWAFRDIHRAAVFGHPMPERQIAQALRQELDLARPAACVLAVSETEREVFRQGGYGDVRVLSHAVAACPTRTPFAERADILFVGALFTPGSPNVDSMVWFVEKVMPLLRRANLGARLIVAGRNDALPRSFAARPDVVLLGRVDDLSAWYGKCRIFVAPTRFSAGIPLKIVEAAGYGLPVVATSLLARQLGWNDGVELLVGDDPETFARQCLRLYREPDLWATVQAGALARIDREYSRDCFHDAVAALLADYPAGRRRPEGA